MEISELREYVLLSRTMNFTKAAQELHISQSALSNHIMKMEKEIGVRLIDRSQARIQLTVDGYEFLESASKIVNIYDDFSRDRTEKNNREQNHFIMQTLQHADRATSVLLHRTQEFKEMYPEIQIEIRESLAFDSVDNMNKGITDCGYLGIRLRDPKLENGYTAIPMLEEEVIAWINKSSPLYSKECFAPNDLGDYNIPTWVGIGPNGLENMYEELFENYDIRAKYNPRYCISREDYFLNKIYPDDVVILTEGSEAIHSVSIRKDRAFRGFTTPVYIKTYVVFMRPGTNTASDLFREFLTEKFEKYPRAEDMDS